MPFTSNEESKIEILEASLDCFLEKGVSGTTIVDIAKRAKFNKALIYYYFSNKENLIRELILYNLNQINLFLPKQNTENDIIQILLMIKNHFRKFVRWFLIELMFGNEVLIKTTLDFFDSHKINFHQQFNSYFLQTSGLHTQNLTSREAIVLLLGILFSDVMLEHSFPTFFNIEEKQKDIFIKNYNNFISNFLSSISH